MESAKSRNQVRMENIKFLLMTGGGLFGDGYLNNTIGLGMLSFTATGHITYASHSGSHDRLHILQRH